MPYRIVPSYGIDRWKKPSGNINKLNQSCIFESGNFHGIPHLKPYKGEIPKRLVCWHDTAVQRSHASIKDSFIHYFCDDYYFEPIWTSPKKLLTIAKTAKGFLSPTFSVYEVQPRAMNIWNVYRNRWVCKLLEHNGIPVIPVAQWADESTFNFCFEGIPHGSVVALSTVGTYKKEDRKLFFEGFDVMLNTLVPRALLVYGEFYPLKFEDYINEVHYYPSEWAQKREKMKGGA